ncbi:MAG: oligosaccharide flippase family protein [Deltaproteobacteria bacterium]|nr:oligosaccharide flippase family protein [Deltaproteobacteria bacterium]
MASSLLVLKNLFWLMLGPLLRLAIGIPLAGFTAHRLGLTGYGEFNLALSFVVMFGVLANLGLNEVLARSIAQRPAESQTLWSSVTAFKAGPLAGYVVIVTVAAWLLGYSSTLLWLVPILGGMQWVISLDNSVRSVFVGHQRMQALGWMDAARVVLETTLTLAVLLLGCGAIALAAVRLAVVVLGLIVSILLLSRQLQVRFSRPRLDVAVSLLPAGCRFAATAAIQSVYERIGFVLLASLAGAPAVALVTTAMTLTEKLFWFVPAVQGAIFPFFSRLHVTAQERFGSAFMRALRYQTVIAAGCGLGLSLLGPWVIRLIFPQEFWVAGSVVEVLGWMCVPKLLNSFLLTVCQSLGKERQASWISAAQCGISICANIVFVHFWGIGGFAWAYLTAETSAVVLQAALLRRMSLFTVKGLVPVVMALGGSLVIFFATTLLPGGRENFVELVGFMACYPLLIVATRSVSGEDVRYLQGLWASDKLSAA